MIVPVLLSGGVGSRLWPLSRELFPKQFLPLVGDKSLLVQTSVRSQQIPDVKAPIVVCNDAHRFLVAEQLREIDITDAAIILEPVGRNTAPAIAVAALQAISSEPEALLMVMPADHVITDTTAFNNAISVGAPLAKQGQLVTFGIVPTAPETGYGYIKAGDNNGAAAFSIQQFVEKPDLETAQGYLEEGGYFWNSGMFLIGAKSYLDELALSAPDILDAAKKSFELARNDLDFVRLDEASFASCPSDSIDYAVMEKTDKGVVVPLSCGWSDVGAWSTLWDIAEKDAQGNAAKGDVLLNTSKDCYVNAQSRLVTLLGVEDLVVVETADAVMVSSKGAVQDIKTIVSALKNDGRTETNSHTKVYRPWGTYESLVTGDRFQVKRITVNPGQRLSLQMHHHRAEHWIVVNGIAKVTCGDEVFSLSEDESTYIPIGTKHRLENPGVIPLELIEVQSGSYLGEDDIVRFEDVYGRSE